MYNKYSENIMNLKFINIEMVDSNKLYIAKERYDLRYLKDNFLDIMNLEKLSVDIIKNKTYWLTYGHKENNKNIVEEGVHRVASMHKTKNIYKFGFAYYNGEKLPEYYNWELVSGRTIKLPIKTYADWLNWNCKNSMYLNKYIFDFHGQIKPFDFSNNRKV